MKQGRHDFHDKLKAELVGEKRNFVQSDDGLCAFCKEGVIASCCVDNFLMLAQDDKKIDELFTSLSGDFLYSDEGEADGCLGAEIRTEMNRMTLKKPH